MGSIARDTRSGVSDQSADDRADGREGEHPEDAHPEQHQHIGPPLETEVVDEQQPRHHREKRHRDGHGRDVRGLGHGVAQKPAGDGLGTQ
ncbi:hypothetical protein ACFYOC_09450 [Nocardiopsis alba]|uniref:hypothetical protein n=1 Tax=Nocardiopsis alba TaxID=53437 RepID=UPI0036B946F4